MSSFNWPTFEECITLPQDFHDFLVWAAHMFVTGGCVVIPLFVIMFVVQRRL
jgi:hypothetical protein